ncbi:MAG: rhodanese-like domain-containing protein [Burkholderiaceae bacterium]
MKRYKDLLEDAAGRVTEIMPWDLAELLRGESPPLLIDVREPGEFERLRIPGSINVPRGVLEQACEWDYAETEPLLAARPSSRVVIICRSGNRSLLAADVLQQLGFEDVVSLRTGVRGWNDFDQPVVDASGRIIDGDTAEQVLSPRLRPDQRKPTAT